MPADPPSPKPRRGKLSLSRRQFFCLVTASAAAFALPTTRHVVRRRRKGEPGPTGWFGHC
jgi:hypothetical protein